MLIATLVALIAGLFLTGGGDHPEEAWEATIEKVESAIEDDARRGHAVESLRSTGATIHGRIALLEDQQERLVAEIGRHDATEAELMALYDDLDTRETMFQQTLSRQQAELRRWMTRDEWEAAFTPAPSNEEDD